MGFNNKLLIVLHEINVDMYAGNDQNKILYIAQCLCSSSYAAHNYV